MKPETFIQCYGIIKVKTILKKVHHDLAATGKVTGKKVHSTVNRIQTDLVCRFFVSTIVQVKNCTFQCKSSKQWIVSNVPIFY